MLFNPRFWTLRDFIEKYRDVLMLERSRHQDEFMRRLTEPGGIRPPFVMRPPQAYGLPIGVLLGGMEVETGTVANPDGTFSHTLVPKPWNQVKIEKKWVAKTEERWPGGPRLSIFDEAAKLPDEYWESRKKDDTRET